MKNGFLILLFLLFSSFVFSQPGDRLTCRQQLFYLMKECEENHTRESFQELREICDSIAKPEGCLDNKSDAGFWAIYAKANFDLARERNISNPTIIRYCESSIAAGYKAISFHQKSFFLQEDLPQIMRRSMEMEEQIYFRERDSTNYWRSELRMDTVAVDFPFPNQEKNYLVHDTVNDIAVKPFSSKLPASAPINYAEQVSKMFGLNYKIWVSFYNDSNQITRQVDSTEISITIIDTVSKEKYIGHWVKENGNQYYLARLFVSKVYSISISMTGCNTRNAIVRTPTSASDALNSGIGFYLFKPGTPFYYEQNIQTPFHEYDKLIYMVWNSSGCSKQEFDNWRDSLGLIPLGHDSVNMYRRADGKSFDPKNDSLMMFIRSHPEKAYFVGPILKIYKTGNPRILGNTLTIYFTKDQKNFSPQEKKQFDKIVKKGNLKYLGGDKYSAPLGMGYELNRIIAELNQLPFVNYAYPETYSIIRTL